MGLLPSRLGYQPTLATELAELEERICSTASGAITSVQAVYVPADDFTDPAATHTFAHLSSSIVLSRKRASEGLYPGHRPPAVRLQNAGHLSLPAPGITRWPRRCAGPWRCYEELKDIIAMLGLGGTLAGRPAAGLSGPAVGAFFYAAVFQHRAIHRPPRENGVPGRRPDRLRKNPERRIHRLSGKRPLYDRRHRRGPESHETQSPAAHRSPAGQRRSSR